MIPLNVLTFEKLPIFQQLSLEEALLRTNQENWILINMGSPKAIVMGISAIAHEVINLPLANKDAIPIIRRFSGGGTVIVDENTLFVTFIFQKKSCSCELYPRAILEWCASFFQKSLCLENFSLHDQDFTLGDRKIAGNAQYIQKERFLHHTSLLWDFSPAHMEYLLHPKKEPLYRNKRPHTDFITSLAPHMTKEEFKTSILSLLHLNYQVRLNPPLPSFPKHRVSTKIFPI